MTMLSHKHIETEVVERTSIMTKMKKEKKLSFFLWVGLILIISGWVVPKCVACARSLVRSHAFNNESLVWASVAKMRRKSIWGWLSNGNYSVAICFRDRMKWWLWVIIIRNALLHIYMLLLNVDVIIHVDSITRWPIASVFFSFSFSLYSFIIFFFSFLLLVVCCLHTWTPSSLILWCRFARIIFKSANIKIIKTHAHILSLELLSHVSLFFCFESKIRKKTTKNRMDFLYVCTYIYISLATYTTYFLIVGVVVKFFFFFRFYCLLPKRFATVAAASAVNLFFFLRFSSAVGAAVCPWSMQKVPVPHFE